MTKPRLVTPVRSFAAMNTSNEPARDGEPSKTSDIRVAVGIRDFTVVLSVYGELDADNAEQLADVLCHFMRLRRGLIIDASALRFCGVAGIRMFCELNRYLNAARVHWVLVLGRHAHRVAEITDEMTTLPTANSVSEALKSPALTGQGDLVAPRGRSGRIASAKPG